MTTSVANPAESRMGQRFKTLSDVTVLARNLDQRQISGDLPPVLAERLGLPRYRNRLERRFLRRVGAFVAAPELLDSVAPRLASFGEPALRGVIVETGVMCQYAVVRRIIDQSVLKELSASLGLSLANHDARRATSGESIEIARAIASPFVALGDDTEAIVDAVLRDGLQCWTCWVHSQSPALQGFFNALIPSVPQDGTNVASEGCQPRDCRRRSGLFAARLDIALADREEPMQKDA